MHTHTTYGIIVCNLAYQAMKRFPHWMHALEYGVFAYDFMNIRYDQGLAKMHKMVLSGLKKNKNLFDEYMNTLQDDERKQKLEQIIRGCFYQ